MIHGEAPRAKIGIIGAGAWGTALGIHSARIGHDVLIWAREKEVLASPLHTTLSDSTQVVDNINDEETRENRTFLPGYKIPESMRATQDLSTLIDQGSTLLLVVPTPYVESTLKEYTHLLENSDKILVSCTKGILNETFETVDEILHRILPQRFHSQLAYLSGPSFAKEVADGLPTVVTIAASDMDVARKVQELLSTSRFRCYRTKDVAGVELGGALKNVLAIACGISDGLNCGSNGRAALITRGLNEITRLAVRKGANPLTMGGLAGMGDLVLTCTGDLSRNRTVGLRIGRGEKLEDIQKSMKAVAEGVLTSKAAFSLAKKLDIECPIIEGIYKVIHLGADPVETLDDVMTRALKEEIDPTIRHAAASHV